MSIYVVTTQTPSYAAEFDSEDAAIADALSASLLMAPRIFFVTHYSEDDGHELMAIARCGELFRKANNSASSSEAPEIKSDN